MNIIKTSLLLSCIVLGIDNTPSHSLSCSNTLANKGSPTSAEIAQECAQEILTHYKGPALANFIEGHAQASHYHLGPINKCSLISRAPQRGSYFSEGARTRNAWDSAIVTECREINTRWQCQVTGAPPGCLQGNKGNAGYILTTALEIIGATNQEAGHLITIFPAELR